MKYELITGSPEQVASKLSAKKNYTLETFDILDEGKTIVALVGVDPTIVVQHDRTYYVKQEGVEASSTTLPANEVPKGTKCVLTRKGPRFVTFVERWNTMSEQTAAAKIEEFNFAFTYDGDTRTVTVDNLDFPEWPVMFKPTQTEVVQFDNKAEADSYDFIVPESDGNVNVAFYSKNFSGYSSHGFDMGSDYVATEGGQIGFSPMYYLDTDSLETYNPNTDYYMNPQQKVVIVGDYRTVNRKIAELPNTKGAFFTIHLAREKPSFYVITVMLPVNE